jgi:hypothetical protein
MTLPTQRRVPYWSAEYWRRKEKTMNTKVNINQQHELDAKIHRQASQTVRSDSPAGGEVSRDQYMNKDPAQRRDKA